MIYSFRTIVQACFLGALLVGLWGCSGSSSLEDVAILQPTTQWQTLQTEDVSLDIPPGFVGGEPGLQLEEMQATLEAWDLGDRTDWLEQNVGKIDLLAFQQADDGLDTINVVQAKRPEDLSLDIYLQRQVEKLSAAGVNVSKPIVDQDNWGILQIETEALHQNVYVYPENEAFWVITYSGSGKTFGEEIEQSRQSFQILATMP